MFKHIVKSQEKHALLLRKSDLLNFKRGDIYNLISVRSWNFKDGGS